MKKSLFSKILLLALALATILGLFVFSPATLATRSGQWEYTLNNGYARIIRYCSGSGTDVTIPSKIDGYPVNAIGYYHVMEQGVAYDRGIFYGTNVTSVSIPDSVTIIDKNAFKGCTSLTSVTIPDSVTSIGKDVFEGTAYYKKNANWTNGVLYNGKHLIKAKESLSGSYSIRVGTLCIAQSAFVGCRSLESVTIPDSVTGISDYVFASCTSLKSVTIPDSVTRIGTNSFYNCSSLKYVGYGGDSDGWNRITIVSDNSYLIAAYRINNVVKFNENGGFTYFLRNDGSSVVVKYSGDAGDLLIPSKFEGNPLTEIGKNTFRDCPLTSVTIPDSVTSIGDYAFSGCTSLKSVAIPDGVTSIGESAFYKCFSLTSVSIPDSVTSIDNNAFDSCTSLTCVMIPDSVMSIGEKTFYNCTSLESLMLGNGVTRIGASAFKDCTALKSITIPDSVTIIENEAFYNCTSLENLIIGNGVTSIGKYAFRYCSSLENLVLGNGVTYIGEGAFSDCVSLTGVTIPNSVKRIYSGAFSRCNSLRWAELSGGIQFEYSGGLYQGGNAIFLSCDSLRFIFSDRHFIFPDRYAKEISSSVEYHYDWQGIVEAEGCEFAILNDGTACLVGYTDHCPSDLSIPSFVDGHPLTKIYHDAFADCTALTNVLIPDGVTSVDANTFKDCTFLTSVTIGNGVMSIEDHAFSGCNSLTRVTIPGSVTSIEGYAFKDCTSLANVTVPDGVKSIGDCAFNNCSSLTDVTIADSVRHMGYGVFTNTAIYQNKVKWAGYVLYIDHHLVAVDNGKISGNYKIREDTVSIAAHAFVECNNLTGIIIPDGVREIGVSSFLGCAALKEVKLPAYLESIGRAAFSGTAIESITIPNKVKTIGESAFAGCESLTNVKIGRSVKEIGRQAFYSCPCLASVYIPKRVTDIGSIAFGWIGSGYNLDSISGFTIYGHYETEAEKYAKDNYLRFKEYKALFTNTSKIFKDIKRGKWYTEAVDYVYSNGLMNGVTEVTFAPDEPMSRAMLVTVLWRADSSPVPRGATPFMDLKAKWYKDAVAWAYENSIVNGLTATTFGPNASISREQIATIIYRYAEFCGDDVSARADLSAFPDATKVSKWAKDALSWAVAEGIISGTKSGNTTILDPKGNATRAQVATILMRYLEK